ncbi:MAG TPA: NUDIX hydrolase [Solirubrobacterales bacterium]|jgi:8-oxo-dGTP pyrophosphatase MutT (NUDIX family)|nr:NUDIX hydrolase [Solirubrobacterales bacterium]
MTTEERKPVTPRPAASVVLMRRGGKHGQRALEVLMLQRSPEAAFFPGAWVFPGGACEPEDGEGPDGYRACALRELREEAGIELPAEEELIPFCRFVTPEAIPRRFDAWFFMALAPAHTPPKIDGGEIVDARWFRPAAALADAEDGALGLAFPTRIQLGWLAEHATSADAMTAYRGRSVEPLIPEVIGEGEDTRIILPGIADSRNLKNLVAEFRRG